MKLPRLNFSTAQLLLLTALVALCIALATAVYQRVRRAARPVAAAWSTDGKLAAVRDTNGQIRIWNQQGQLQGTVKTGVYGAIWMSPPVLAIVDEKHVDTTNDAGKIEVWSISNGRRLGTFGNILASPTWETASISGDGRRVATIRIASTPGIDIWDVARGVRSQKLDRRGSPKRLALSHDGSRLAIIEHDGSLSVIDVAGGQRVAGPVGVPSHDVDRHTVALSGDLNTLAVVDRAQAKDGTTPVIMLDMQQGPPTTTANVPGECETLTISRNGQLLATASPTGDVTVWRTSDGKQLKQMTLAVDDTRLHPLTYNWPEVTMAFSPDGRSLLAASNSERGIYDVPTLTRRVNLGVAPNRLGRWFFVPAFIIWAIAWGYAARRSIGVSPVRNSILIEPTAGVGQARRLPYEQAPRAMIAVWILLTVGGVWGIAWAMFLLFADLTCLALTPFPYVLLFIGLRATAAGTSRARSEFNLPGIALLQMVSLLAGDPLSPPIGLVNFLLLRHGEVRQYRGERGESKH